MLSVEVAATLALVVISTSVLLSLLLIKAFLFFHSHLCSLGCSVPYVFIWQNGSNLHTQRTYTRMSKYNLYVVLSNVSQFPVIVFEMKRA